MAINRLYSKQMKVDDMEDKNKKENKDLDRRLNKAKSIEEISELISHQMIYLAKAVKKIMRTIQVTYQVVWLTYTKIVLF